MFDRCMWPSWDVWHVKLSNQRGGFFRTKPTHKEPDCSLTKPSVIFVCRYDVHHFISKLSTHVFYSFMYVFHLVPGVACAMAAVGRVAPWVLSWRTVPLFRTPGRSKSEFAGRFRGSKYRYIGPICCLEWKTVVVVVVVVAVAVVVVVVVIYMISTRQ